MDILVRDAKLEDAERILDIYAYYVENTAITFEYVVPTLMDFQKRMEMTFVGRAAYDWSCELTVYLDHTAQKCGLGRKIYEALENRLSEMGILNLYACIGYPRVEDEYLNSNSAEFHAHLGFSKVGEFYKCGYKFGRWYNMIWMEKIIGKHHEDQPSVKFPE